MAQRRLRPLLAKVHELGHAEIDLDHHAMAECWDRVVNCAPIQFPFFMARFKKVMRDHFDHEAALLAHAGGHLWEAHRLEHRGLLELCDRASRLAERNCRKAQSLLRNELARMFREHVVSMDQIAVLILNTRADEDQSPRPPGLQP
jgi:hemerythrin